MLWQINSLSLYEAKSLSLLRPCSLITAVQSRVLEYTANARVCSIINQSLTLRRCYVERHKQMTGQETGDNAGTVHVHGALNEENSAELTPLSHWKSRMHSAYRACCTHNDHTAHWCLGWRHAHKFTTVCYEKSGHLPAFTDNDKHESTIKRNDIKY